MSSSSLSQINAMAVSHMNALAVSFLQEGDYRRAILALKRGLATLKSSLYEESAAQKTTTASPLSSASTTNVRVSSKAVTVHSNSSSSSCAQGGALFEVFPRAFDLLLPPPQAATMAHVDENSYKSKASLVILYNMGLAYHLSALATGSSQELRVSLDLYKMALAVVDTCLFGEALLKDESLLLQLLALFNNMGHIHSCYFQAGETTHCMGAIRALIESKAFQEAKKAGRTEAELFRFFEWNDSLSTYHPFFAFAPAA